MTDLTQSHNKTYTAKDADCQTKNTKACNYVVFDVLLSNKHIYLFNSSISAVCIQHQVIPAQYYCKIVQNHSSTSDSSQQLLYTQNNLMHQLLALIVKLTQHTFARPTWCKALHLHPPAERVTAKL